MDGEGASTVCGLSLGVCGVVVSSPLCDEEEGTFSRLKSGEQSSNRRHLLLLGCGRLMDCLFPPLVSVLVKAVEEELMDLKPDI